MSALNSSSGAKKAQNNAPKSASTSTLQTEQQTKEPSNAGPEKPPTAAPPQENAFVRSAAILTEHLGYVPIALVDDVINAANEILYKCTAAMDQFLSTRYPSGKIKIDSGDNERSAKRRKPNGEEEEGGDADADAESGEVDIVDEIELGTAKFETLFESIVDKCFDKFELYVLRNLFVIPLDLIQGGWMRLAHHRGVDFRVRALRNISTVETADGEAETDSSTQSQATSLNSTASSTTLAPSSPALPTKPSPNDDDLNAQIIDLYHQIEFQKTLSKLLRVQTTRTNALITDILEPIESLCHDVFEFKPSAALNTAAVSSDGNEICTLAERAAASYKEILPLEDTISFLSGQVSELITNTGKIQEIIDTTNKKEQQGGGGAGDVDAAQKSAIFSVNKSLAKFESTLFVDTFVKRAIENSNISSK